MCCFTRQSVAVADCCRGAGNARSPGASVRCNGLVNGLTSDIGGFKGGARGACTPRTWYPKSFRRCRLAPLEYLLAAGAPLRAPLGELIALPQCPRPPSWREEASFPLSRNPIPAIDPLGLWLRPIGSQPCPLTPGAK